MSKDNYVINFDYDIIESCKDQNNSYLYDFRNLNFKKINDNVIELHHFSDEESITISNATFDSSFLELFFNNESYKDIIFNNCHFKCATRVTLLGNCKKISIINCDVNQSLNFCAKTYIEVSHFKIVKINCLTRNIGEIRIYKGIYITNLIKIIDSNLQSFSYYQNPSNEFSQNEINYTIYPINIFVYDSEILDSRFYSQKECLINKLEIQSTKINHLALLKCKILNHSTNESHINSIKIENSEILSDINFEYFKNKSFKEITLSQVKCLENLTMDNLDVEILVITNSIIEGFFSIQSTKTKEIKIQHTTFNKSAYFDKINIKDLNKCSEQTLRTIKQQFQKTDNQIEFERFKVYELHQHKKSLSFRKKTSSWFILWVSYIYSNHGTNWIQAILVTIILSLLMFSLFTLVEDFISIPQLYNKESNLFINQFINFLMPTNYNNPLLDKKEMSFNNGWSIPIFLLGKILIGIGIYETIKSFRKFRL